MQNARLFLGSILLAFLVACSEAPIEDQSEEVQVIRSSETVEPGDADDGESSQEEGYLAIEGSLSIGKEYQAGGSYLIELNWSDVEGAETYKVLKGDKFITTGTNFSQATISGIKPNEEFDITIVACDFYICSESPYTKSIQAPPAPVTLKPELLDIDSYSMQVSWTAPEGATKYLLYIDERFYGEVTEAQAKIEGLSANSDVGFQLSSCSDTGCSPASESFSYRTAMIPLSSVQLWASSYKDSTAESRNIDFAWQVESPWVNLYKVYLNDELVAETTETKINLDNFAAETDYRFTVRQCVSGLCASASTPIEFLSYLLPPESLELVNAYANAIHLSWSDNPKAAFYKIYRDGNFVANESTTQLVDTGVEFGVKQTYSYQVKACIDAENCSSKSQAGEFTTDLSQAIGAEAPDPPTNFNVSDSDKRVKLFWGTSSNAEFYRITRNNQLLVGKTTENLHLDFNFPRNEYLTYAVASCVTNSEGVEFCFQPVKETILTSPTPPDSIVWQSSSEGVNVSWAAVNNREKYILSLSGIKIAETTETSYLIKGLDYSAEYILNLQTCNLRGCSDPSENILIQTVPDRISGDPQLTIISPDLVRYTWNQYPKDGVKYSLLIDGTQHFVSLTATDITFLEKNAEHSIQIAVCDAIGCGAYTPVENFFLKDYAHNLAVPPQVSLASETDKIGTILDDGSLSLAWEAIDSAHYYEITREDANGNLVTTSSTNSFIDDRDMQDRGFYTYTIKACLEGFDGDVCGHPFVKVFYYPPGVPELRLVSFSSTVLNLAWEQPGEVVDEYKLYKFGELLTTLEATSISMIFEDKQTIEHSLQACNPGGCSDISPSLAITPRPDYPTTSPGIYEVGGNYIVFELDYLEGADYYLIDLGLEDEVRYDLKYPGEAPILPVNHLEPETQYDISYKACNQNCTPSSPVTSVLTLPLPPQVENYFLTQDSIYLEWEQSPSAHEYKVFLEGEENLTTAATHATLSNLEPATYYELEVKACNTSGCSELFTTMGATTLPQHPTASPEIYEVGTDYIIFELGSFIGNEYVLADLGLEYEYRYDLGYTGEATKFAVTGLTPETNYDISFKNCHHSGCTPSSPATRVLTLANPPWINNYSLTDNSIYLDWEERVSAHEYKIFLQGEENLTTVTTEATINNLLSSKFYEFEVKACNTSGCSNLQITMGATTLPEPVENISYTQGSTSIHVIFDEPPRVLYYKVYNFGNFAGTIEAKNIHNSTIHFNIVSLEIGLEACNTNGCSPRTTGQEFTPLSAPVSFAITPVTQNSASISWEATNLADKFYQIHLDGEVIADNLTVGSYQLTNLEPGQSYAVDVAICRVAGCLLNNEPVVFATIPRQFNKDNILVEQAVSNQVNLILEMVLGADRYKIDFSGQQAQTIPATTRFSLYPSPSHTGDYELVVTACNRSGCAEPSEAYKVEFAPTSDPSVTWYQIAVTDEAVDVSWTTDPDASFYKLYLEGPNYSPEGKYNLDDYVLSKESGKDISGFSTYLTQVLPIEAATQTYVLDASNSKISKSSTYMLAVLACNASGCTSIQDSLLQFRTFPAPGSLAIESTSSSEYSIFVDWSGLDDSIDYYIVEIENPDLPYEDNKITIGVEESEMELEVPISNAQYEVNIYPCIPEGCSKYSAKTFVYTLPDNYRIVGLDVHEKKLDFSWVERPTEDATLIWTFEREDGHRYNQDIPEGQPDIYSFVSDLPFDSNFSYQTTRQVSLRGNFAYIDQDILNPIDYTPFELKSNSKYKVSFSVCGFYNCNTTAATYLFSLPPDPTKFIDFDFRTDSTSISTYWTDPDEADTYLIYVDYDYSNGPAITTNETNFTLNSLTTGATYSIAIYSCNLEVCSYYSMDFDLQVGPGPVSASGTILSSGDKWLEMSWQLDAGHSFPEDQLFGIFLNDSNQPVYLGPEPESWTDAIRFDNLELGTNYEFSLAACYSLYSCGDRLPLFEYLTWPVKPEILLPEVSTNTISLSWVEPEEEGLVYGVIAGGVQFEMSEPATTFTNLQPGTPYSFYAANCRTYAKCTLSDEVIIWTIPLAPTQGPNLFVKHGTLEVSVQEINGAVEYEIYDNSGLYRDSIFRQTDLVDTAFVPLSSYQIYYRACVQFGCSENSPPSQFTYPPVSPEVQLDEANLTQTSARIYWDTIAGAESYQIHDEDWGFLVNTTDLELEQTNLLPGSQTELLVSSCLLQFGCSYPYFVDVYTLLDKVTNVYGYFSENQAFITWSNVAGASHYDVYVNGEWQAIVFSSSYEFEAERATDYSIEVRACLAQDRCSEVSEAFEFFLLPKYFHQVPEVRGVAQNAILVDMEEFPKATSYRVYDNYNQVAEVYSFPATITGFTGGQELEISLKACNTFSCTEFSNTGYAKTFPELITQPSVAQIFTSQALIEWESVQGLEYVKIYQNDQLLEANEDYRLYEVLDGLVAETLYTIRLQACNSAGCSGLGAGVDFTTSASQDFSPIEVSNVATESFIVQWDEVPDTSEYRLYLDNGFYSLDQAVLTENNDAIDPEVFAALDTTGKITFEIDNLSPGKAYQVSYTVCESDIKCADLSQGEEVATLFPTPYSPYIETSSSSGLVVTMQEAEVIPSQGYFFLQSDAYEHNVYYEVYLNQESSAASSTPTPTYELTGLEPGQAATISYKICHSYGCSEMSQEVAFESLFTEVTNLQITHRGALSSSFEWDEKPGVKHYLVGFGRTYERPIYEDSESSTKFVVAASSDYTISQQATLLSEITEDLNRWVTTTGTDLQDQWVIEQYSLTTKSYYTKLESMSATAQITRKKYETLVQEVGKEQIEVEVRDLITYLATEIVDDYLQKYFVQNNRVALDTTPDKDYRFNVAPCGHASECKSPRVHVDFTSKKESQIIVELGASAASTKLLGAVTNGASMSENFSILLSDQNNCDYTNASASSCPGYEEISSSAVYLNEATQDLYGYTILGQGGYGKGRLGIKFGESPASVASLPFASYKKAHFKTMPDVLNSFAETLWLFADYGCEVPSQIWKSADGANWQQVAAPPEVLNRTDFHLHVLGNPDKKYQQEFLLFGGRDCSNNQAKTDMQVSEDGKNWTQQTSYIEFPTLVGENLDEAPEGQVCPALNYSYDRQTGKIDAWKGNSVSNYIMPYSTDGIISVVLNNELYILSTTPTRETSLGSAETPPQGLNHYIVRKGGTEWLSLNNAHQVYSMAYDHKYSFQPVDSEVCEDQSYLDDIAENWPLSRYNDSYLQEDMLEVHDGLLYVYKYDEDAKQAPTFTSGSSELTEEKFGLSLHAGSSPLDTQKVNDLPFPYNEGSRPIRVDSAVIMLEGFNTPGKYLNKTWVSLDYGISWQLGKSFRNFAETPKSNFEITQFGGYNYIAVNKLESSQGTYLPGIYRFASDLSFSPVNAPHENAKAPELSNSQVITWNNNGSIYQLLLGDNPHIRSKEIYLYAADSWLHYGSSKEMYSLTGFSALSRYDGSLFILGGENEDGFSSTIYASLDGSTWYGQSENVNFPLRKDFAAFTFNGYMTVFGGENEDGTLSGELWSSVDGTSWYNISPQLGADPPPPMKGSQAVVYDEDSVLLTGGLTDEGYSANTYELENGRAAVQKTGYGSGITERAYHSMLVHRGIVYVFGGMNEDGYLNSLEYSLDMDFWHGVDDFETTPRANAGLFHNGKEFVVYGGNDGNQEFTTPLFSNSLIENAELRVKSSYGFVIGH